MKRYYKTAIVMKLLLISFLGLLFLLADTDSGPLDVETVAAATELHYSNSHLGRDGNVHCVAYQRDVDSLHVTTWVDLSDGTSQERPGRYHAAVSPDAIAESVFLYNGWLKLAETE